MLGWKMVSSKDLCKGISLIFQPELIMPLDVFLGHIEVWIMLRVIDDCIDCSLVKWTNVFFDLAIEPVMPALESIIRL